MSDNTLNAFELAIELSGEPRLDQTSFSVDRGRNWDGAPAQSISLHPATTTAAADTYQAINDYLGPLNWESQSTWINANTGTIEVTIFIPKDTTPGTLGQQFLDAQQVAA